MQKITIVNDTTNVHAGSAAVMSFIYNTINECGHNVISKYETGYTNIRDNDIEESDVIIVNAEGTFHAGTDRARLLVQAASRGKKMGKKVLWVNSVCDNNPSKWGPILNKVDYICTREIMSTEAMRKMGVKTHIDTLLDFCVCNDNSNGNIIKRLSGIVKGSTNPSSTKSGQQLDKLEFPFFDINRKNKYKDSITTIKQAKLYLTGQHHGVYAAAIANTPFIPLYSNCHKIESLIKWSGIPIKMCRQDQDVLDYIPIANNNKEMYIDFFGFIESKISETKRYFTNIIKSL